jgi:ferric-dicitrate binding protein FerR (iron transport regulator)
VGARGHDMTVALENGAVIVQAAKRTSGHLYVKTPDCRVAVTGTVFSVNFGLKGSRVAVLRARCTFCMREWIHSQRQETSTPPMTI